MKKQIPNLLTLANLLCGSVGIIASLEGDLLKAAFLIQLGACFDFLDGFVARILRVHSPLGKELDSLADVITFGLLPSLIYYQLLSLCTNNKYTPYAGLVLVACAAWRLARFNNTQPEKSTAFQGLSTTAYAMFVSTLPTLIDNPATSWIETWLLNPTVLIMVLATGCLLLVSRIPFISLKFSSYTWEKNWIRYAMLLITLLLTSLWGATGLSLSLLLYIILGHPLQRYAARIERKSQ